MRFVRMNYDHASAEDSWQRILTFFDAHLGLRSLSEWRFVIT